MATLQLKYESPRCSQRTLNPLLAKASANSYVNGQNFVSNTVEHFYTIHMYDSLDY